jgi:SAM-dependent methyltransferase
MARQAKRAKQMKRPGPAWFLRKLGIRRSSYEQVYTDSFWRAVRRAGGDPSVLEAHSAFSPQAGEVFFITEEIAKRSLSAEYDDFLEILQCLDRLEGDLPTLRRVADLGGGTGIVAMYLAATHPSCKAVVYDHAPIQLELGRKWATEHELRDIEYVQASYQQVAATKDVDVNDLVLFLRGLDLRLPTPGTGDVSIGVDACVPRRPQPGASVQAAMTGLAKLMSPQGLGVIGCKWSSWGLMSLFEAIRRAGMGVDWRLSRCKSEVRNGQKGIIETYIIVRRGMPHLGKNSREDALAFLRSSMFPDTPLDLGQNQLNSWLEEYHDGDELLLAKAATPSFEAEQVRIVQKDGMLFLRASSANGAIRGSVHSLAGIADLLEKAQFYLNKWRRNGQGGILQYEIHPRLKRFIRFCQRCSHEGGPKSSSAE